MSCQPTSTPLLWQQQRKAAKATQLKTAGAAHECQGMVWCTDYIPVTQPDHQTAHRARLSGNQHTSAVWQHARRSGKKTQASTAKPQTTRPLAVALLTSTSKRPATDRLQQLTALPLSQWDATLWHSHMNSFHRGASQNRYPTADRPYNC